MIGRQHVAHEVLTAKKINISANTMRDGRCERARLSTLSSERLDKNTVDTSLVIS